MSSVPAATKPGDVVCMLSVKFRTKADGDVFMFPAIDVYSEFLFQAPVERGDDMEYLLKSIQVLMGNKDFKKQKGKKFALVLPAYQEHRREIELLIQPHGGKLIFNEAYVLNKTAHAMEHFLRIVRSGQ